MRNRWQSSCEKSWIKCCNSLNKRSRTRDIFCAWRLFATKFSKSNINRCRRTWMLTSSRITHARENKSSSFSFAFNFIKKTRTTRCQHTNSTRKSKTVSTTWFNKRNDFAIVIFRIKKTSSITCKVFSTRRSIKTVITISTTTRHHESHCKI